LYCNFEIAAVLKNQCNIFLAAYLCPNLLNRKEWESVFDNAIKALWLEWGGFSTIDRASKLYFSSYTGEDNKSYHRGDSWYWINNIAAIALKRFGGKYDEYVNKIIKASSLDIQFQGVIGRPSEISDAKSQKAQGNLFQLWSAATFIELINSCN